MIKAAVWKSPTDSPFCPGMWCVRLPNDPNVYTAPEMVQAIQFANQAIGLKRMVRGAIQKGFEQSLQAKYNQLPDHIRLSNTIH